MDRMAAACGSYRFSYSYLQVKVHVQAERV